MEHSAVSETPPLLSNRWRFQAALLLAVGADALQLFVMPLFSEGALSPFDDVLDIVVAVVMVRLLGFHWEFLPAFAAEIGPGVDLAPFWTLAVGNVYRKWKAIPAEAEPPRETPDGHRIIEGEQKSM
jgi:hypothetical protein